MASPTTAAASLWLAAVPSVCTAAPVTAEQALARHRAATSIGADPCRTQAGDEIVVCGRRESPYSLPLYESSVGDDGMTGREREDAVDTMRDVVAPCRIRGETCLKPLPILRIPFGGGKDPGIIVGRE